jgi:hypothetical protein
LIHAADAALGKLQELHGLIPARAEMENGIVFMRLNLRALWQRGGPMLRCGVKRGDDLFFFDSGEFRLWRFTAYFS